MNQTGPQGISVDQIVQTAGDTFTQHLSTGPPHVVALPAGAVGRPGPTGVRGQGILGISSAGYNAATGYIRYTQSQDQTIVPLRPGPAGDALQPATDVVVTGNPGLYTLQTTDGVQYTLLRGNPSVEYVDGASGRSTLSADTAVTRIQSTSSMIEYTLPDGPRDGMFKTIICSEARGPVLPPGTVVHDITPYTRSDGHVVVYFGGELPSGKGFVARWFKNKLDILGQDFDGAVHAVIAGGDVHCYAAGKFRSIGSGAQPINTGVALHAGEPGSTQWHVLGSNAYPPEDGKTIYALGYCKGNVVAAGDITRVENKTFKNKICWYGRNGWEARSDAGDTNGTIYALSKMDWEYVHTAGDFTVMSGVPCRVARSTITDMLSWEVCVPPEFCTGAIEKVGSFFWYRRYWFTGRNLVCTSPYSNQAVTRGMGVYQTNWPCYIHGGILDFDASLNSQVPVITSAAIDTVEMNSTTCFISTAVQKWGIGDKRCENGVLMTREPGVYWFNWDTDSLQGPGMACNAEGGSIAHLALDKHNRLYAAGTFTAIGGRSDIDNGLAMFDGYKWHPLDMRRIVIKGNFRELSGMTRSEVLLPSGGALQCLWNATDARWDILDVHDPSENRFFQDTSGTLNALRVVMTHTKCAPDAGNYVLVQGRITLRILVTNTTSFPIDNVQVEATIPPNYEYSGEVTQTGGDSQSQLDNNKRLVWTIRQILPGYSRWLNFTVTTPVVNTPGQFTCVAKTPGGEYQGNTVDVETHAQVFTVDSSTRPGRVEFTLRNTGDMHLHQLFVNLGLPGTDLNGMSGITFFGAGAQGHDRRLTVGDGTWWLHFRLRTIAPGESIVFGYEYTRCTFGNTNYGGWFHAFGNAINHVYYLHNL
jgi:hypothetical protein